MKLELPGVDHIRIHDLVDVRQDDSFAAFRTDLTDALSAASPYTAADDVVGARAAVEERMTAAAHDLAASTQAGTLARITVPKMVNWTVGAALGGMVSTTGEN